jgi:two-component system response regulator GlrR
MPLRFIVFAAATKCNEAADLATRLERYMDATIRVAPISSDVESSDADLVLLMLDQVRFESALALCESMRTRLRSCPVLVVGAQPEVPALTSLLAAGAFDFVVAWRSDEELVTRIRRAVGLIPVSASPQRALPDPRLQNLVGTSPAFLRQVARLAPIAGCDAGVLILGETGTGKELFAQAIHYTSARASRPWVAVNCGSLPPELIEDELFGHVKGAYTHAHVNRPGLVHEAEGGSLFLDDVDCLPLSAQSKLLRFLQEREYRPVGSNQVRRADVRVIAASNRDLAELTVSGAFRKDLYYRLNILTLSLPALRDRREDIPALALLFLRQFAAKHERQVSVLSPQTVQRLLVHDWPGNVRELQHLIERAVLFASGPVLLAGDLDLTGTVESGPGAESFRAAKAQVVRQFERSYIEQVLASAAGNITHAARAAKKNRRAFFALVRKHGIELERFRNSK